MPLTPAPLPSPISPTPSDSPSSVEDAPAAPAAPPPPPLPSKASVPPALRPPTLPSMAEVVTPPHATPPPTTSGSSAHSGSPPPPPSPPSPIDVDADDAVPHQHRPSTPTPPRPPLSPSKQAPRSSALSSLLNHDPAPSSSPHAAPQPAPAPIDLESPALLQPGPASKPPSTTSPSKPASSSSRPPPSTATAPVPAPAAKPKSKARPARSPSPSPPPQPPPPPLQTIRLEIHLGGPEHYEVDIAGLAKETGQRAPTPVPVKRDTSESEGEGDDEQPAGAAGEGTGTGTGATKKKRKKNLGTEYYDISDPFIDDSELAIDERTFFAQTKQQGFYVSSGEVALLKDKPTPKKGGRGKKTGAAAAGGGAGAEGAGWESGVGGVAGMAVDGGGGGGPGWGPAGGGDAGEAPDAKHAHAHGHQPPAGPFLGPIKAPLLVPNTRLTELTSGVRGGDHPMNGTSTGTGNTNANGNGNGKGELRRSTSSSHVKLEGGTKDAPISIDDLDEGSVSSHTATTANTNANANAASALNAGAGAGATAGARDGSAGVGGGGGEADSSASVSAVRKRKLPEDLEAKMPEPSSKKRRKAMLPFHPELEDAIADLKIAISQEDWGQKGRFPPSMKPILGSVAIKAVILGEYNDNFFNLMPTIFPYNKFTMTKLIKRTIFPDHLKLLQEREEELLKELADVAKEGLPRAEEEWEKHLIAFEKRKAKLSEIGESGAPGTVTADGTPNTDTHPPLPGTLAPPPPAAALERDDAGSGMEVDTPAPTQAAAKDALSKDKGEKGGEKGDVGDDEKMPQKKYRLTDHMKGIIWNLVCVSNECCRLENEKNSLENVNVQISEQGLRKTLYKKIVDSFPEGWMTSGHISREVSAIKKKLEKEDE